MGKQKSTGSLLNEQFLLVLKYASAHSNSKPEDSRPPLVPLAYMLS